MSSSFKKDWITFQVGKDLIVLKENDVTDLGKERERVCVCMRARARERERERESVLIKGNNSCSSIYVVVNVYFP